MDEKTLKIKLKKQEFWHTARIKYPHDAELQDAYIEGCYDAFEDLMTE